VLTSYSHAARKMVLLIYGKDRGDSTKSWPIEVLKSKCEKSCDNPKMYTVYSLVVGAGYDVEKLGVN
jgi:hypothetical protein